MWRPHISRPSIRRFVVWWLSATFWHGAATLVHVVVQSEMVGKPDAVRQAANPVAEWLFGSRSLLGLIRPDLVLLETEPRLALALLAANSIATGALVAVILFPIGMLLQGPHPVTARTPGSSTGRSITMAVIAFAIGLHGAVVVLQAVTGQLREWIVIRTTLTMTLCAALWLGYEWARWTTMACLCAAAGYGLFVGLKHPAPEMTAIGGICLVAAALVSSRPVGRFLC